MKIYAFHKNSYKYNIYGHVSPCGYLGTLHEKEIFTYHFPACCHNTEEDCFPSQFLCSLHIWKLQL